MEARLLEFSNRFTTYSFYLIELELGRMILDVKLYNHSEPDFSISPRGHCGRVPSEIFESIYSLQYLVG